MHTSWSGTPQDLTSATAAGLTRGQSLPYQRLEGFAEAEMRYRQQRMLAEVSGRRSSRSRCTSPGGSTGPVGGTGQEKSQAQHGGMVTRWTTWLSSVLPRRSSRESANSSACAN
ncbi:hypothetical protein GCM10027456_79220 [Kineosporia babensis]